MLSIFYGENRAAALAAARKTLGEDYEVIEGEALTLADLPSIFLGSSLFSEKRHILIKELLTTKDETVLEKLPEYLSTPHQIVMLEDKLDKRTALYKSLAKVTMKEFNATEKTNQGLAFDIYDTALRNGAKAVEMTTRLEETGTAPEVVIGAWTWKTAQNYKLHPNAREQKAVLRMLAKTDLQIKQSSTDPWLLLKTFLLELSSR